MPVASPKDSGPLTARGDVSVDLLDASAGLLSPALQALSQGGAIRRVLPGWRYRVRIQATPPDPLNDPVLETPYFDDITFYCRLVQGPAILNWQEGE